MHHILSFIDRQAPIHSFFRTPEFSLTCLLKPGARKTSLGRKKHRCQQRPLLAGKSTDVSIDLSWRAKAQISAFTSLGASPHLLANEDGYKMSGGVSRRFK